MPRPLAQQAFTQFHLPKFSFRLPIKKILKTIGLVVVLAGIAFAVWKLYEKYESDTQRQAAAKTVAITAERQSLTEALRYRQCPGARTIVINKNTMAKVNVRPDCWSGWIIIKSHYYYLQTYGNKNLFIWRKNKYDSRLPPGKLLDGTNIPFNPNNEGYFKLKGDKGSLLVIIEGR